MRRLSFVAAAAVAVIGLAACSSSSGGGGGSSSPTGGTTATAAAPSSAPKIIIKNFGYTGALTVKAGAKVTVVNDDSVPHTLTDKKTRKFDTGSISGSGGTGTFTAPSTPGKYPFGCTFHPEMAATLTVTS